MRFRGRIKQALYGHPLFYRGYFPYFGQKIFFPRGSVLFSIVCADGVYEKGVISVINAFVRPGTTYIDVGANIGLLSIPILTANPETKVVAIEASPKTVEYLERTHSASGCGDRWTIIGAAGGGGRTARVGHDMFIRSLASRQPRACLVASGPLPRQHHSSWGRVSIYDQASGFRSRGSNTKFSDVIIANVSTFGLLICTMSGNEKAS